MEDKDQALAIAVTPSAKLRPSQAKLYAFIVEKHKASATINLPQVIEQYSTYGCRRHIGNQPAIYSYDWKEHRHYDKLLVGDELKLYAIQWFIRNLGIFVVKGLLTAVPTMELSDLQIEGDD